MNSAILLTVRCNSKRLPNKALLKFCNNITTIEFLLLRLKKQTELPIILCTSLNTSDDELQIIADKHSIKCFRGSEDDKLLRWYDAARYYNIHNIITVDGDDPFTEPYIIKQALQQLQGFDFIKGDGTGIICGSFTYAFTFEALERVCNLKNDDDTEMMWVYFLETGIFKTKDIHNIPNEYYNDSIRMTLDYYEDFQFFNKLIKKSIDNNIDFDDLNLSHVLTIIKENPYIKDINFFRHVEWKENQHKKTKLIVKNNKKFGPLEKKYINEILDSAKLSCTSGNWTTALEKSFSKKVNCKYGVAFNSGTSTMHAALLAVGVKPGDEVICPAISVIMNTSTTIHANAIPVYVDVNPNTFNIDPIDLEYKITKKTKAIFIVSVYGLPCDLDEILTISRKYNIPIIEDNAECVLSKYKGNTVGSLCDISSFSFENSKHVSCGEGGMITTNNKYYALQCRKIGGHGFKTLKADNGAVKKDKNVLQNPDYERHDQIGWNYRLPEINACLAYAQVERLESIVDLRIKSAEIFLDVIKDCDYLIPQSCPSDRTHSYWALGIIYNGEEKIGVSWVDFRQKYIELGGDGFYGCWQVPYLEPVMYSENFKNINPSVYKDVTYTKGLCHNAEHIQKKLMVFKTNYRNLDLAKYKAYCLQKTIKFFN